MPRPYHILNRAAHYPLCLFHFLAYWALAWLIQLEFLYVLGSQLCLMIEEFLVREKAKGNITSDNFTSAARNIKLHGHCQQKAIASTFPTKLMLSLPVNYHVQEIRSGCCGMAGSFGYEKEHYDLSMKIGNLVLFPEIVGSDPEIAIAAPGTSCRHHILDGTGSQAKHPIELLYEAIR